jgi:hypothetical protein
MTQPTQQIAITLSSAQVDRIVRAAEGGGGLQAALSGLAGGAPFDVGADELDDRRLSRSLLMALLVLATFPKDGSRMGVAEIARILEMNTSTVHRYLSTWLAAGYIDRDPATRRYGLAS